jgi:hypothetical protein
LYSLVEKGQLRDVIEYDFSSIYRSCSYTGASIRDVLYARQIQAFYSKNQSVDLKIDRQAVAMASFRRSEDVCRSTNRLIQAFIARPGDSPLAQHSHILWLAAQRVADVLGSLPSVDRLEMSFGPGAQTNVKGGVACPRVKLSVPLQCSNELAPFVGHLLAEAPEWTKLHAVDSSDDESWIVPVDIVKGKLLFVPKNAKTDRSIMVEPILNGFLQKGIGSYIRARLMRFGINLDDQSINQRKACKGSVDDSLATIDLSAASDTISRELVKFLLPFSWFDALDCARTGDVTLPDGTDLRLEKFSSMGNGFTFELESLIFYSLAWAVAVASKVDTKEISVFGDDIIIPSSLASLLSQVFDSVGFSVNSDKSYVSGPFRESCGTDYLYGYSIRPFYQKVQINGRTLFNLHNFMVRHGEFELAKTVLDLIPKPLRIFGPDGYGDGHLIGSWEPIKNRRCRRDGWEGAFFETYTTKPRYFVKELPGDRALPTYSVYVRSGKEGPTDCNIVRGHKGYAKVRVYTLRRNIFR